MCKECAKKLSPWFDDRRHSTVAQIEEQLKYREENKSRVAAFRVTRTLGERTKVHLDEDAKVFMVTAQTNPQKLAEENPDVLNFSDVTGCELNIDENRTELTRTDKDGNSVSYHPPRYQYDYDFFAKIYVRNPYFDDMCFRLNSSSVTIEPPPSVRGGFDPECDAEYRQYKQMGEELKQALLQARQQQRDAAAAQAAPKAAMTCPWCGATTTPDASGCCAYCGGALGA